jgi:hypothetical protein
MVTVNADAPPIDVFFLDYPETKKLMSLERAGLGRSD